MERRLPYFVDSGTRDSLLRPGGVGTEVSGAREDDPLLTNLCPFVNKNFYDVVNVWMSR